MCYSRLRFHNAVEISIKTAAHFKFFPSLSHLFYQRDSADTDKSHLVLLSYDVIVGKIGPELVLHLSQHLVVHIHVPEGH